MQTTGQLSFGDKTLAYDDNGNFKPATTVRALSVEPEGSRTLHLSE
jgi:hypothetical protein